VFAYADSVQRLLGPGGTDITVPLILFCLGIQILWSGGSELLHSVMHPPPAAPPARN
jgi:multiple antibiotic resistance protein